jgi:hypothetical protein
MKKVLALLLIAIAATSFAEIRVNWGVANGYYFGPVDTGVGILPDGSGADTWMQLVSVGANGTRDWAGTSLNEFWFDSAASLAGDDLVLASYQIFEDGILGNELNGSMESISTYAYTGDISYVNPFAAGSVYARIFQDGNPDGGDWYAFTETMVLANLTGTDFPQTLSLSPVGFLSIDDAAAVLDPTTNSGLAGVAQVIPEPATILLFGIGGFGAWLLRRRQQA